MNDRRETERKASIERYYRTRDREEKERAENARRGVEYHKQPPLDAPIMDVLKQMTNPKCILFCVRPGRPSTLMCQDLRATPVPHPWIVKLVQRGYIDPVKGSKNKVEAMGWIQYDVTYEGQQALNRR